jgi:MFS transporter, DHA1 family, tetracycline resistance protein
MTEVKAYRCWRRLAERSGVVRERLHSHCDLPRTPSSNDDSFLARMDALPLYEWMQMTQERRDGNALTFILITAGVNAVGIGIILPILPRLLVELTHRNISSVSVYGGWLTALYFLTQFLTAPVLGNLSDRFGRRPILIGSLTAFGINYLIMGFAPNITWLFVGRALAGAFAATNSTASAYVADVTEPGNRSSQFGMLSAAFSAGVILGPMIGGFASEYGTRVPFFVAAALSLLNVIYGLFILPESLQPANRRAFSFKRANPFRAFMDLKKQRRDVRVFGAFGAMQVAMATPAALWTYYTTLMFGWSQKTIGISLGLYGLSAALVEGIFTTHVNRRHGYTSAVYLGFNCMIIGLLVYAFATYGWMIFVCMMPLAVGAMIGPTLVSYLAGHTPPDRQGALHGTVASVQSIASIFAPLFMTQMFYHFSAPKSAFYFPGAPFVSAAIFAAVGLLFATRVIHPHDENAGPL